MMLPSHLVYKSAIKRLDFEKRLISDFNQKGLFVNYAKVEGKTLALYYVQGEKMPIHVAAHSLGQGWIFKHAYD